MPGGVEGRLTPDRFGMLMLSRSSESNSGRWGFRVTGFLVEKRYVSCSSSVDVTHLF